MINKGIPTGTKIKVHVQKKWIAAEVVSHDAVEGWLELKSKNYENFTWNTFLHDAHLKIPEAKPEPKPKKKRTRRPRVKKAKKK